MNENELKVWEKLHSDKDTRGNLRECVRRSWEISDSYNIDYEHILPKHLNLNQILAVKEKTKRLYIYTGTILKSMLKQNVPDYMGMLLFYRDGTLIKIYGNDKFQQWAADHHIEEDTLWDEKIIGANIFSLGMNADEQIKLEGYENYAHFLTEGAYYFSKIAFESGAVYGGVAIVVPMAYRSPYLEVLAVSVTRAIELQMTWFRITENYNDVTQGYCMFSLDQSDGKNYILTMGESTFSMLDIPSGDYYYKRLEMIIDPYPLNKEFWKIVNQSLEVTDKMITISVNHKEFKVSLSLCRFKESKFHMNGVTLSLMSQGKIKQIVQKYSNNIARYKFEDLIGESPDYKAIVKQCRHAAKSESNILLLGESGVGKDVIAQAIHNDSSRKKGPFVAINCAAFSKELITSELFGYEPGAFTGAKKNGNIGKFELANHGTLFLDEIGDMPLDLQAVLLRVLEERCFMKLGSNQLTHVDVRIIAATNKNLKERIEMGLFREDLFYRLSTIKVIIPPLRERKGDILLLVQHFIKNICSRIQREEVHITRDALELLEKYPWPGNVRELQNLLEGVINTQDEDEINKQRIYYYLKYDTDAKKWFESIDSYSGESDKKEKESGVYEVEARNNEREKILKTLAVCRNNKAKAAKELGMSRSTFYRRLQEFNIR